MAVDEQSLLQAVLKEFERRIFTESIPRIIQCLDMLSEEQVWFRPNPHANSIGTLVLHLEGNVRQWILSGLLGMHDNRDRPAEFDLSRRESVPALKARLIQLKKDISKALEGVSSDELLKVRAVQVYEESGLSILIHVIEHFSYHTGQIAWITKSTRNEDLGFYAYLNT